MIKRRIIMMLLLIACLALTACGGPGAESGGAEPGLAVPGAAQPQAGEADPKATEGEAPGQTPLDKESAPTLTQTPEAGKTAPALTQTPAAGKPAAGAAAPEAQSPAPGQGESSGQSASGQGGTAPGKAAATDTPTCFLSINCAAIRDNLEDLNQDKLELVPEDGVILAQTEVAFFLGDTCFDILLRECKERKIHLKYSTIPLYKSKYVEGIHNLYEFDCGEQSGWIYRVNGVVFSTGSSAYELADGDVVEWIYSCGPAQEGGSGEPQE